MTEELKDKLIAKMLDAPVSLSDEELETILQDEELLEIYEVSSVVSGVYAPQPNININEEWARFRPKLRRKPSSLRMVMRISAIFLGVLVFCGILGDVFDRLFTSEDEAMIVKEEQMSTSFESLQTISEEQVAVVENDNTPVQPTPQRVLPKSNSFDAESKVNLSEKVDQSYDLDVEEYLRIQQARIDNDLAMLAAEELLQEYAIILQMYDLVEIDDEVMESTFGEITMQ